MTVVDPGMAFWLGWAQHRGALAEEEGGGGSAVVIVPDDLQRALGVPEELAITADPDAAREEGALLLVPGQPVLDRAADLVLHEGDAGRAWLPWPHGAGPTTAALVAAAREQFPVDHGRIDGAGEPAAVYTPLLRLGVLVTYTLSLDLRFQEREEVWLDARTGRVVPERARRRLEPAGSGSRPREARPELPADAAAALASAHAVVTARAADRLVALARHADDDRHRQLAAADAYYRDALASVERRRATAAPDRLALLEAQADAIAVERSRRLAEIEATFAPRHELRPYRAHLVFVPALQVPVDVRRGSRAYPLTLTWLRGPATFADIGCPHCGASALLVAGRHHLGCRACLPPPALTVAAPAGRPGTTAAPSPSPSPADADTLRSAAGPPGPQGPAGHTGPAEQPPTPARRGEAAGRAPAPRPHAGGPVRAGRRPERPGGARARVTVPPRAAPAPGAIDATGRKLADELWLAVRFGERWPRKGKGIAADSPLAAAVRVYGPEAPARAIGLADGRSIADVTAITVAGRPLAVTTGVVWAGPARLAYSLRWSLDGTKPVVSEILPYFGARGPRLVPPDQLHPAVAPLLTSQVPDPRHCLDPVADAAWRLAAASLGLPAVLRCLAAWWRVADQVDADAHPAPALAAALVRLVAARSGLDAATLPTTTEVTATDAAVDAAARVLKRALQLARDRPW